MSRGFQQRSIIILVAVLCCISAFSFVYAGNGDGTGGGAGGGKSQPVELVSSEPENGSSDVSLDTVVVLNFNKNVVNFAVKENNKKCFSLTSGNEQIPIEVQFPDDQIEPDKKRTIVIKPTEALKQGQQYVVKISSGLKAKNGLNMDASDSLTFQTIGDSKKSAEASAKVNGASSQAVNVDESKTESITSAAMTTSDAIGGGDQRKQELSPSAINDKKMSFLENKWYLAGLITFAIMVILIICQLLIVRRKTLSSREKKNT